MTIKRSPEIKQQLKVDFFRESETPLIQIIVWKEGWRCFIVYSKIKPSRIKIITYNSQEFTNNSTPLKKQINKTPLPLMKPFPI